MQNALTVLDTYKLSAAMSAGLERFYVEHPEVDGIALDTIRDFARERFLKAAANTAKLDDPRFELEAPAFVYRLLVKETLLLAQALR